MTYSEATVTVSTPRGLHATPAAMLSQLAMKFSSKIVVTYNGRVVNAKVLPLVVALGAKTGDKLQLQANGEDAEDAISALIDLIEVRKFDGE